MGQHDRSSTSITMPVAIPKSCLYTVICLFLLLCGQGTHADIIVLDKMNRTIGKITNVMGARFGPPIPEYGVWGHVNLVDPVQACVEIKPPPETATDWIALIKRQKCDFDVKVLNAQLAGYVAAIVYNDHGNELVPMGSGSQGYKVDIPSAFIGLDDAEYLYSNFDKSVKYSIILDSEMPFNVQLYLVPFAIVVGICFVLMLVFMIVKWVRDIRKRRRSRLSKTNLKKIPIKKFKKGDDYDMCAICLDEYEEGEKLRILPCSHGYHQKCIDPWLTKNKKTCPICKRKVVPGRESDSSSSDSDSSDDDDGGGGQTTSETTPLLPAQDLRQNSLLRRAAGASMVTGGGTFDNSGLPEAVRRCQLAGLAETATSSSDDDDDDDEEGATGHSMDVEATSWEPGSQLDAHAADHQHNTALHRTTPPPTYQIYDETSDSCNTSVAGGEAATMDACDTAIKADDLLVPPTFDDMSEDLSENHFAADDDTVTAEVATATGSDPLGVEVSDPHGGGHGDDDDDNKEPRV